MRSQISNQSLENEGDINSIKSVPGVEAPWPEGKVGRCLQRCRVPSLDGVTHKANGRRLQNGRAGLS